MSAPFMVMSEFPVTLRHASALLRGGARGVPIMDAGPCRRGAQAANSSARGARAVERVRGPPAWRGRELAACCHHLAQAHVVRWTYGGGDVFRHLAGMAAHICLRLAGLWLRAPDGGH